MNTNPIFIPARLWQAIVQWLQDDPEAAEALDVICPFSGNVEEYLLLDRLGGQRNIWPARFRAEIELGAE